MTLDEFIKEEQQRLRIFEAWWRANMAMGETQDGEVIWPVAMGSGDWDDHYHAFDPAEAVDVLARLGASASTQDRKMTSNALPPHPWPIGLRLISVNGECDEDDGRPRETGREAEGVVVSVDNYKTQGWTYGVCFPASGVHIVLDEADPLTEPEHYRSPTSYIRGGGRVDAASN